MVKKVVLGTGIAVLLGLFFFGRGWLSYVRTAVGQVKQSVKGSVPVEFEIERARQMIKEIEPEVQNAMHVIAKQEVEVEEARKAVAKLEARLAKEQSELETLHADVKSGKKVFEYCGKKYTPEQVRTDMARRFDRLRTGKATLEAQQKSLLARERNLDGARQKLDGMLAARRQLQVDVDNLMAQQQLIAAARTVSDYNFDDSHLGRVKELVDDLRTRLEVDARLANAEPLDGGEIQVTPQPGSGDIVDQVGAYFAQQKQPVASAEQETKGRPEAARLANSGK